MQQQILGLDMITLLIAIFFIIGVMATKISARIGIPALVLFMIIGMIFGSDGFGIIYFDNYEQAKYLGILALIIILFEGGLQTRWTTVEPVAMSALSLATLGVFLTAVFTGVAAKVILDVTWLEGLLFGAIVGSTDAAAVFAVLKGQNLRQRLSATLETESGSNDPMAVFLTVLLIQLISVDTPNYLWLGFSFFWQMGVAIILGVIIGKLAVFSINGINLDSSGLYPVFSLGFALLAYSIAALVGASGFLAVYVAALVIGNAELTYQYSIIRFNEGFAWMMQIIMFLILGLLIFPTQVFNPEIMIKGLLLSGILIFMTRPFAVFLSLLNSKFVMEEKLLLSWAGLRGAVPIVLAIFPIIAGLEIGPLLFNVVFFVVFTSTLIQGSTIMTVASKLDLLGAKKVEPPHSIELISIGKANAEIVEFEISEDMVLVGKNLQEISFPKDLLVTAVVRDGNLITPSGQTVIQPEDHLYILVSRESKEELKKMICQKKEDFCPLV